jgi:hypothetical protein
VEEVDGLDPAAEHELDVPLRPELAGAELDAVALPGEELLGEGRPLVGSRRLLAHEDDAAVESLGPERLRTTRAGQARADDDDAARGHAACSPLARS